MYFLLVLPFKYKYRITAWYSALDEKHAFASLAMFDIQYLIKEWLDTCVIWYPCINHILKQSMKIVTVSVHRKWDRLVIYWHALVLTVWWKLVKKQKWSHPRYVKIITHIFPKARKWEVKNVRPKRQSTRFKELQQHKQQQQRKTNTPRNGQ